MSANARPRLNETKLRAQVAFLREAWRSDGAEGETVHAVCDAVEALLADRDRQRTAARAILERIDSALAVVAEHVADSFIEIANARDELEASEVDGG